MMDRCRVCGSPTNDVNICNFCRTAREEQRFLKMVTREEIREARLINNSKNLDFPKKAAY